jgi:hypothetical protein
VVVNPAAGTVSYRRMPPPVPKKPGHVCYLPHMTAAEAKEALNEPEYDDVHLGAIAKA